MTNKDPTFSLVPSSLAATNAKQLVNHYLNKGLLMKIEGFNAPAKWMNLPMSTVKSALHEYQQNAKDRKDVWGKTTFAGVPQDNLAHEVFYI